MSRSGYTECEDHWSLIRYRGALASAIRGRKGQAFLKDLLAALDAMPQKRLIAQHLVIDGYQDSYTGLYYDRDTGKHVPSDYDAPHPPQLIVGADELCATNGTVAAMGEVCALGALGKARGIDMSHLDPEDAEGVAEVFAINDKIVREIVEINDEDKVWVQDGRTGDYRPITPEERWQKVRNWVAKQIWEWKETDEEAKV